ncbi:Protein giant-lens, partial [Pseudolycoriella hygida]
NSERDLPVCAPNAVCSKIDLYETPWIERQCRCPKSIAKHSHIINHPKELKLNVKQMYNLLVDDPKPKLDALMGSEPDADSQHLKTLFRKLGVFYDQDDIVMDENDYNDYHTNNQLNHKSRLLRKQFADSHDARKFRHSNHKVDIQRIGGCPSAVGTEDGHTIADKTRHYKLCEPVHKLPICGYFNDFTWTLKSSPALNVTEQVVHCRCPKNSITYLIKREPLQTGLAGYTYLFACSPQSRLRCQRKEPCKLFTVRKRQEFLDEVNTNPLCQCPRSHRCPRHHTDAGVLLGKSYIEDNIRTYSGYCMPDN